MLRSISLTLSSIALIAVATGCGKDPEPGGPQDAAPVVDTGVVPDTGIRPDTGVDAGQPDLGNPDLGQPDLGEPDAGNPDAIVYPDAAPPNVDVNVSGQVRRLGEYLAGTTTGVGEASVLAYGVPGNRTVLTQQAPNAGNYSLTLPQNGQILLYVNKLGYFPTVNQVTTAAADIQGKNLYLTEVAWLNAIALAHNVDLAAPFACHAPALNPQQQCIYTAIVARILDDGTAGAGTLRPVAGITAANITVEAGPQLSDMWYKRGPYFLDYTGTASVGAQSTIVYNDNGNYRGGYIVTFLEIPQLDGPESIDVRITARYDLGGGEYRYFGPTELKTFRPYAVTWTTINETGVPPPQPQVNINFDTQIYPLFLPVAQGGFGCIGCHTNQNGATPAGGMNLYGGPDVAFASLKDPARPQRVQAPPNVSASYVLVRPLYEAAGPQDHPIFAFASDQDPGYRLIYQWITEGAVRNVVQLPVSFENEVRILLYRPTNNGGIGCYNCHVNGVNANNAPGGFYMGGNADDLYAELTAEAPTDITTGQTYRIDKDAGQADQSLILIKPLFGNPINHPVKIFSSNADPRYQTLYRWISEGYNRQ